MTYVACEAPCPHLITDWCFTAAVEPGEPRGFWAGEDGGKLLADFESAVNELEALLDGDGWPDKQSRKTALRLLPEYLRPRQDRYGIQWTKLLEQRIAASPGYVASNTVQTDSMASDAWDVHWAREGRTSAAHVEALFREYLTSVRAALYHARSVLRAGDDTSNK